MTARTTVALGRAIDDNALGTVCRRWKIRELALFGSILTTAFKPESDVDVLVTFDDDAPWDLFDLVNLRDELAGFLGRPVDLVERRALVNPYRRRSILSDLEVLYAA